MDLLTYLTPLISNVTNNKMFYINSYYAINELTCTLLQQHLIDYSAI